MSDCSVALRKFAQANGEVPNNDCPLEKSALDRKGSALEPPHFQLLAGSSQRELGLGSSAATNPEAIATGTVG